MSVQNDGSSKKKKRVGISRKQYTIWLGGKKHRARFATAAQGREWQRRMRMTFDARKHGLTMPIAPQTTDEVVEAFLHSRQNLATIKHDTYRLKRYFLPRFTGRLMADVQPDELTAMFGVSSKKQKGWLHEQALSLRTVNMIRTLLYTLFEFALSSRSVAENIVKHVDPWELPDRQLRYFTTETQIQKFVEAASKDHQHYYAFVMIALNTGLRMGNIITLRWCDVDFELGAVIARHKYDYATESIKPGVKAHDGQELVVGLSDALRGFLIKWRSETKFAGDKDFICANQTTGKYLTRSALQFSHGRTMERSGLPYVNVHGLRHTFATMYLERGGKVHDLKHILNHSTVTITENYTHNTRKALAEKAKLMGVGMAKNNDANANSNDAAKKVFEFVRKRS